MTVIIRGFDNSASDLEALAPLYNRSYGDRQSAVEEWRHTFATAPKAGNWRRWIAETNGRVMGLASHGRDRNNVRPGSCIGHIVAAPDVRSRGVGRNLYEHLLGPAAERTRESIHWIDRGTPPRLAAKV